MAACPNCKSERCGNHAACARRHSAIAAAAEKREEFAMLFVMIGMTERAVGLLREKHLGETPNPMLAMMWELGLPDTRRTCAAMLYDRMADRNRSDKSEGQRR